jgi:hypothetical protein
MLLVSGDFHGNSLGEIDYIKKTTLQKSWGDNYEHIKAHIICGDGGFLWPGAEKNDRYNFKFLERREFPVYVLFGNHENYEALRASPVVVDQWGNSVYRPFPDHELYYMERGRVYNLAGLRCLVLGGALSVDKHLRRNRVSWWEEEYWSTKEKQDLVSLLQHENTFDYVFSHTCPFGFIEKYLLADEPGAAKLEDDVAEFIEEQVIPACDFKAFFFGHFHTDVEQEHEGKQYVCLYTKTALLGKGRWDVK